MSDLAVEMSELGALPHAHRQNVRAFLAQRGVIWTGCRLGLYRTEAGVARFQPDWAGDEVTALGPAEEGIVLATARDGGRIHLCDHEGRSTRALPPLPGDKASCVIEHGGAVWAGGKRGVYRLAGDRWLVALPPALAGEATWIRADGEALCVALGKTVVDGRPRVVTSREGDAWTCAWIGEVGDRALVMRAGRVISKWTGDADEVRRRPVLAAHLGEDGTVGTIQDSTLTLTDAAGQSVVIHDDLVSRAFWLVPHGAGSCSLASKGPTRSIR